MSTDLLTEVARRGAKREEDQYGIEATPERLADLARALAPIVADVLDILSQDGRVSAPIEPGLCWHDSGTTMPNTDATYRCELKAGHLGAHECQRGNGSAVWPAEVSRCAEPGGEERRAEAGEQIAQAIEAGVQSSHPNEGYKDGFRRAAQIAREVTS